MLSFGSVATTSDGAVLGEFEATLHPLDNATTDDETTAFLQTQPAAYQAATCDPRPAALVMPQFVHWIRSQPGDAIFVAHPLGLDDPWIDYYLQRFTSERLIEGPWRRNRLFRTAQFCLMSYAAAKLRRPLWDCDVDKYDPHWLGQHAHTHRAIDDARGYASFLAYLLKR
jgi:hypothetical protein